MALPDRSLASLTAAATDTVAQLALIAQYDYLQARFAGDQDGAMVAFGEMLAYREVGSRLIAVCREAIGTAG
jgi:hypothetical protein